MICRIRSVRPRFDAGVLDSGQHLAHRVLLIVSGERGGTAHRHREVVDVVDQGVGQRLELLLLTALSENRPPPRGGEIEQDHGAAADLEGRIVQWREDREMKGPRTLARCDRDLAFARLPVMATLIAAPTRRRDRLSKASEKWSFASSRGSRRPSRARA